MFAQAVAEVMQEQQMLLDAQTISMVSGLIIPLLVGVITKIEASSGLKALLNAILSATAGVLATVTQVDTANLRDFVIAIGTAWVASVATYYGVWKPTGVAGTVTAKTADFGIGSPPLLETDEKGAEDAGLGAPEIEGGGTPPDPAIDGPPEGTTWG